MAIRKNIATFDFSVLNYTFKIGKMGKKRKKNQATNLDAIKAMRRGGREAERELFGPGFHSLNHVHKSKKTYTRKKKHSGQNHMED